MVRRYLGQNRICKIGFIWIRTRRCWLFLIRFRSNKQKCCYHKNTTHASKTEICRIQYKLNFHLTLFAVSLFLFLFFLITTGDKFSQFWFSKLQLANSSINDLISNPFYRKLMYVQFFFKASNEPLLFWHTNALLFS